MATPRPSTDNLTATTAEPLRHVILFGGDDKYHNFQDFRAAVSHLAIRANRQKPFWIDLFSPSHEDMLLLQNVFHVHPLTIEDCTSDANSNSEKVEAFDSYLFIITSDRSEYLDSDNHIPLFLIVFQRFVISIHHRHMPALSSVIRRLRFDIDRGAHHPKHDTTASTNQQSLRNSAGFHSGGTNSRSGSGSGVTGLDPPPSASARRKLRQMSLQETTESGSSEEEDGSTSEGSDSSSTNSSLSDLFEDFFAQSNLAPSSVGVEDPLRNGFVSTALEAQAPQQQQEEMMPTITTTSVGSMERMGIPSVLSLGSIIDQSNTDSPPPPQLQLSLKTPNKSNVSKLEENEHMSPIGSSSEPLLLQQENADDFSPSTDTQTNDIFLSIPPLPPTTTHLAPPPTPTAPRLSVDNLLRHSNSSGLPTPAGVPHRKKTVGAAWNMAINAVFGAVHSDHNHNQSSADHQSLDQSERISREIQRVEREGEGEEQGMIESNEGGVGVGGVRMRKGKREKRRSGGGDKTGRVRAGSRAGRSHHHHQLMGVGLLPSQTSVEQLCVLLQSPQMQRVVWTIPSPSWVVYALVDAVIDSYVPFVDSVILESENLDELVLAVSERDHDDLLNRIGSARRRCSSLRKFLLPKQHLLNYLLRQDPHGLVSSDVQIYLRDVLDHVTSSFDRIESAREQINESYSTYIAQVSVRMNEVAMSTNAVMKRMAFVGTVMSPLAVITGMFGMNVKVPGMIGYDDGNNESYNWFTGIVVAMVVIAISLSYSFMKTVRYNE